MIVTIRSLLLSTAMARPVDVLVMPDGSVLISDDTGNWIFRVTYRE